jgi:hypothetical protein
VGRQKDHRQWFVGPGQRLLQLQPAWSRHLQIEHRATSGIRTATGQEFLCRTKGFDLVICGPEAAGQSAEKRRIVVHQIDDRRALTLDLALGNLSILIGHRYCTFGQKKRNAAADLNKRRPLGRLGLRQSNEARLLRRSMSWPNWTKVQ